MSSAFLRLETIELSRTALFLDFDGTLTPIVDRPDQVRPDRDLIATLDDLFQRLDGALAIVSGREISALDQFLAPYEFPASGVHGLEWRFANTEIQRRSVSEVSVAAITQDLEAFAATHSGLLLERKLGSVALHYRARPDLQEACRSAVTKALQGRDGLIAVEGKMVIEVKGHGGSKGTAVATFMSERPFIGRIPIFIGDDVTDEAGFAAVHALDGISIKVGVGETCAQARLDSPADVASWLRALVEGHTAEHAEGNATA